MRLTTDHARVRVPATSANLGPGFDAFGLALNLWDEVRVRAIAGPTVVHVTGEGADTVSTSEDHLIVRAMRVALDYVDAPQAGFVLHCHNQIPHGRGLGSSAAATVAGLVLAQGLISEPEALSEDALLTLATEFEGHADNAAPAVHGGATIAYVDKGRAHCAQIPLADSVNPVVLVPRSQVSTSRARSTLPGHVPHEVAAFTGARTGLLTLALSGEHDLFLAATEDRLHQEYRANVMPATINLVHALRGIGAAAVVSGAGPSILVLDGFGKHARAAVPPDWAVWDFGATRQGAQLLS